MTYAEKLKNPLWQKNRLKILERDYFSCVYCGDKETELQIHHTYYEKGKEPWEYPDESLQTTCKHCHNIISNIKTYATYIKGIKYKTQVIGHFQMMILVYSHKYNTHSIQIFKILNNEIDISAAIMESDFPDLVDFLNIVESSKSDNKHDERGLLLPA